MRKSVLGEQFSVVGKSDKLKILRRNTYDWKILWNNIILKNQIISVCLNNYFFINYIKMLQQDFATLLFVGRVAYLRNEFYFYYCYRLCCVYNIKINWIHCIFLSLSSFKLLVCLTQKMILCAMMKKTMIWYNSF